MSTETNAKPERPVFPANKVLAEAQVSSEELSGKKKPTLSATSGRITEPIKKDKPAPALQAGQDFLVQKYIEHRELDRGDFYYVGWSRAKRKAMYEPSARVLQSWALLEEDPVTHQPKEPINCKVLEASMDREKAWAHVRAWIGPEEKPRAVMEGRVTILFVAELELLLTKAVAKGLTTEVVDEVTGEVREGPRRVPEYRVVVNEITGEPRIVLANPADQLRILDEWVQIKRFGDRIAETKAMARCQRKLLGVEWRAPEEIDHEAGEADGVASVNPAPPAPAANAGAPPPPPSHPEQQKKTDASTVSPTALASLQTRLSDAIQKGHALPEGVDQVAYLLRLAIGLTWRARKREITSLEQLLTEDARTLYSLIDGVAKFNEADLKELDGLYVAWTAGPKA
jgi:hypothetical protein